MRYISLFFAISFLQFLTPLSVAISADGASQIAADNNIKIQFESLLEEVKMEFAMPEGFREIAVKDTKNQQYDYAIHNDVEEIEMRYMVRPIKRLEILYDDPHSSAPDPNHVFPLIFQALTDQLANARYSPSHEYDFARAKAQFNADWAAASIFSVTNPDISDKYSNAFLLALHKNNLGDAYILYLFNDTEKAKKQINNTLNSLKFSKSEEIEPKIE